MLPGVGYNDRPPRPVLADEGIDGAPLIEYPALVPAVDPDGNTRAGIRMPELQVPLATYTGWNLRRAGFGEGGFCIATGSYLPFAATRAQREASGDPRPSLQERYGTRSRYLRQLEAAVNRMVAERLLLPEDAPRIMSRAAGAASALAP